MSITTASHIINTHHNEGILGLASLYPEDTYETLVDLIETAWATLETEGE